VRDLVRRVTPLDQQARLSAVESERDRLASELHNSVLPELYTIMAALDTGATPEGVREHLREVDAGLRDLMMDRQTVVLRNGGLVAAAESLLEEAAPEPPVVANIAGAGRPPPAVELAAYRIVQAALDNARRHADARTIWLTVACSPDLVQIEIRDDGQGLATARASHHIGLGLMEIRARANEIGGRVTISGPPGGGWRVLFEWMA
jgi:signal transduction histidine kinase